MQLMPTNSLRIGNDEGLPSESDHRKWVNSFLAVALKRVILRQVYPESGLVQAAVSVSEPVSDRAGPL